MNDILKENSHIKEHVIKLSQDVEISHGNYKFNISPNLVSAKIFIFFIKFF